MPSVANQYVTNNITSKIKNWNSKWGKITTRIGDSSADGAVFATENPLYAVKIQPNSKFAKEESLIMKELNGNNSPLFYKNYIVNVNNVSKTNLIFNKASLTSKLRVIVMERLGTNVSNTTLMSVASFYEKYRMLKKNGEKIKKTIRKLQSKGIFHGNMHMENVLLIIDNKTKKILHVKIIDYGRSLRPRMLRYVSGAEAENRFVKKAHPFINANHPYHRIFKNKNKYTVFMPTSSSIKQINEMMNGIY